MREPAAHIARDEWRRLTRQTRALDAARAPRALGWSATAQSQPRTSLGPAKHPPAGKASDPPSSSAPLLEGASELVAQAGAFRERASPIWDPAGELESSRVKRLRSASRKAPDLRAPRHLDADPNFGTRDCPMVHRTPVDTAERSVDQFRAGGHRRQARYFCVHAVGKWGG